MVAVLGVHDDRNAGASSGRSGIEKRRDLVCMHDVRLEITQKLGEAAGKNGKQRMLESPVSIPGTPGVEHVLSIDGNRAIHNTPAPS